MRNFKLASISFLIASTLVGCSSSSTLSPEEIALLQQAQRQNDIQMLEQQKLEAQINETNNMIGLIPDWYITPPVSNNRGIYEVATATNADLQFAVNQATLLAEQRISRRMASEITSYEMNSTQNSGGNNTMMAESLIESRINAHKLFGHELVKREILPDPRTGDFRVYVMAYLSPKSQADVVDKNLLHDKVMAENTNLTEYVAELEANQSAAELEKENIKAQKPTATTISIAK